MQQTNLEGLSLNSMYFFFIINNNIATLLLRTTDLLLSIQLTPFILAY